jgi:phosphate/sulfate permease
MSTIAAADMLVTLRNLLMAWVLTLPAAGVLYWFFRQIF